MSGQWAVVGADSRGTLGCLSKTTAPAMPVIELKEARAKVQFMLRLSAIIPPTVGETALPRPAPTDISPKAAAEN